MPESPALWAGSFNQNIRTVPRRFTQLFYQKLRHILVLSVQHRLKLAAAEKIAAQPDHHPLY
jgi:hypothetical protein